MANVYSCILFSKYPYLLFNFLVYGDYSKNNHRKISQIMYVISVEAWYHFTAKIMKISVIICGGALPTAPHPHPLATTDENKSTKTWSAWGGKVADLSKEKGQEPFPQWAFTGFSLHRNTSKAHQSLSGSKDQTIDTNKELWGLILSQGQLAKGL